MGQVFKRQATVSWYDKNVIYMCPWADRGDPIFNHIVELLTPRVKTLTVVYEDLSPAIVTTSIAAELLEKADFFILSQVRVDTSTQDDWLAIDAYYYRLPKLLGDLGLPRPEQKIVGVNLCEDFISDPSPIGRSIGNFALKGFNCRFTRNALFLAMLGLDTADFFSKLERALA